MAGRTNIYFDHNAGAAMRPQAVELVRALTGVTGNPSSVHGAGRAARAHIEKARAQVALLAGVPASHVTFTSGASEANVTALSPIWRKGRGEARFFRVLVGASEHASVIAGGRFAKDAIEILPVDGDGLVDADHLARRLAELSDEAAAREGARILVSVMAANNETGAVQPLARIGEIVAAAGAILHVDAVQAAGRVALDMAGWQADSIALSAHKIGGPQGAGALVVRNAGLKPAPLLTGGGQEHWNRAGTENVAAIAGFGIAAELCAQEINHWDEIRRLRDGFESGLRHIWSDTFIFSGGVERLANTSCFAVPGVAAETALIALDLEGIACSSGSACSSGKVSVSHVLTAMGVEERLARCALRVSFSPDARAEEVEVFLAAWRRLSERMRGAGAGRAA
ncbi:cysteine desulfurase family protein [Stappia sp. ICDLI1TA098]